MPLVAALVIKEFQTWLRARFTFALFTGLVVFTSVLVFLLGLLVLAPDANAAPPLFSTTSTTSSNILVANRATFLFGAISLCLLLAAGVVAPAVAASAFAVERERGTLDLLLVQGTGSLRIVFGKVLAALLFSLLILLVALPLFAPAWSFGGVTTDHLVVLLSVATSATLLFSALGVLLGALLRSALTAALFAQGIALFLLFGTLGLHLAVAVLGSNDSLKPLLWLNPFLALLSGGGTVAEAFARQAPAPFRGALSLPVTTWVPGFPMPAWVISSVVWSLTAIVLSFLAAVAIDPCHPLRHRYRTPRP